MNKTNENENKINYREILEDFVRSNYFPRAYDLNDYELDQDGNSTFININIGTKVTDITIGAFTNAFTIYIEVNNIDLTGEEFLVTTIDDLDSDSFGIIVIDIKPYDFSEFENNSNQVMDDTVIKLQKPTFDKFENVRENSDGVEIANCTECGSDDVIVNEHICKTIVDLKSNEMITTIAGFKSMLESKDNDNQANTKEEAFRLLDRNYTTILEDVIKMFPFYKTEDFNDACDYVLDYILDHENIDELYYDEIVNELKEQIKEKLKKQI